MADLQTLLGDAYKEGMSIEEINDALAEKELVDKSVMDGYVPKSLLEKANTEAADYKKKWRSTLGEVERKQQEDEEKNIQMQNELSELRKESAITKLEKNYVSLGYDAEMAKKISEATYEGDMEEVFRIQLKYQEQRDKEREAELMKKMPNTPSGNIADVDFSKAKNEALEKGDFVTYASLVRQESEARKK